ncbi:MAG TPA: hypothetical protein VHZ51_18335 [Ktedonobacteraceae bacterium]|nr:hypothetical protein [Ktedonobacteraceae bacterium]
MTILPFPDVHRSPIAESDPAAICTQRYCVYAARKPREGIEAPPAGSLPYTYRLVFATRDDPVPISAQLRYVHGSCMSFECL